MRECDMTVVQAIHKVIKEHGIHILNDTGRFQSLVTDYVMNTDRELNIFITFCRIGFLSFAYRIYNIRDDKEIEDVLFKAKRKMMNDNGLEEIYAITGINLFLEGLELKYRIQIPQKKIIDTDIVYLHDSTLKKESNEIELKKLIRTNGVTLAEKETFLKIVDEALNGNVDAMILTGDYFKKGHVVERDSDLALWFYEQAMRKESKIARQRYVSVLGEIENEKEI